MLCSLLPYINFTAITTDVPILMFHLLIEMENQAKNVIDDVLKFVSYYEYSFNRMLYNTLRAETFAKLITFC